MIKVPCYDLLNDSDCPERHPGCAINCPKWIEYTRERNREYEKKWQASKDFMNGKQNFKGRRNSY